MITFIFQTNFGHRVLVVHSIAQEEKHGRKPKKSALHQINEIDCHVEAA